MTLLRDAQDVSRSSSPTELGASIQRIADRFEFERFGVMCLSGDVTVGIVHNCPPRHVGYFSDKRNARRDPVMRYTRRNSLPLIWGQENYVENDCMDKWEHQAEYGYASGIVVAAHLPGDRHVALGFDSCRPYRRKVEQTERLLADFMLVAIYAVDASLSILHKQPEPTDSPLTARERECLKWTIDGKTAWEIGKILSISERTAAQHLGTATRKADAATKHQAARKAERLGWL